MEDETKVTETSVKTEEQIKEEAKAEIARETEIKEQAKKELREEMEKEENKKKKKRSVSKIIVNTIFILLLVFVIFETVMGVLDMQRINEDKEPLWYLDTKTEVIDGKTETTYNIGLYVIHRTDDEKGSKIVLKPFFIN